MLCLWLAALPQDPAPELPDPVVFAEELLAALDHSTLEIWERQDEILRAGLDAEYVLDPLLPIPWSDPEIAQSWIRMERLLRDRTTPELADQWFSPEGLRALRSEWMWRLKMPARAGLEPHRSVRLAAADLSAPVPAAAVEIWATGIPMTNPSPAWLHLFAQDGTWRVQGLVSRSARAEAPAPICARAQPWVEHGAPAALGFHPRQPEAAERLDGELVARLASAFRAALEEGRTTLHVQAPAAVALRDLQPLVAFAALQAPRAVRYDFLVDLDRTQRPGVLRFDQSAAGAAHPSVAAGSDPQTWPAALREGAPPAVAGIEMLPDATVADLAATADALLARGVGTLFLSAPLSDSQGPGEPR